MPDKEYFDVIGVEGSETVAEDSEIDPVLITSRMLGNVDNVSAHFKVL